MKPELKCVVDNTVKTWRKSGLLHREDGPAVIKGSAENRIELRADPGEHRSAPTYCTALNGRLLILTHLLDISGYWQCIHCEHF